MFFSILNIIYICSFYTMGKFLTFADYNNDMKSKDGFKSFTESTKKKQYSDNR